MSQEGYKEQLARANELFAEFQDKFISEFPEWSLIFAGANVSSEFYRGSVNVHNKKAESTLLLFAEIGRQVCVSVIPKKQFESNEFEYFGKAKGLNLQAPLVGMPENDLRECPLDDSGKTL